MKKILFISTFFASVLMAYDAEQIADMFFKLNPSAEKNKVKPNHTKGFCASGNFVPSKDINKEVDIGILKSDSIFADLRYSLGGAEINDKSKTRGLALNLSSDNEVWTMVMTNAEINFAKDANEFGQFFEMKIPVNGKLDTDKIKKLTNEVKSYKQFAEYTSKMGVSRSVANTPFYSTHTFFVKDAKTKKMRAVKWKFVPVDGIKNLSKEEEKSFSKDFLRADFEKRMKDSKPFAYDMYLIYANKNDIIDDTTALWTGKHREVLVGRLTVNKDEKESCDRAVYFPSNLSSGVEPPKDPLFDLRNQVYAITFGARK